ncbi:hypothetical protein PIB30_108277 [Stylosanthes scabra]|uniref:RNase H type-1 domain-containing protein n=1 Tax=Stylosanthes scabra TaxID=79078 RepID=A0ABU6R0G5_9FABA|nr:hypothetical protein [Stylosanthes scabra]
MVFSVDVQWSPQKSASFACHSAVDFWGLHSHIPPSLKDDVFSWKPPLVNCITINCDASVLMNLGLAGFGCILRNSSGGFVKACSSSLLPLWGVFRYSLDVYLSLVNFADSEVLMDRDLLDKFFYLLRRPWDMHFDHIRWEANRADDFLAKWSSRDARKYVEWFHPSQELHHIIAADLA